MIPALLLRLRSRWRFTLRLAGVLQGIAAALPLAALAAVLPASPPALPLASFGLAAALGLVFSSQAFRRAAAADLERIARHLDRSVPAVRHGRLGCGRVLQADRRRLRG